MAAAVSIISVNHALTGWILQQKEPVWGRVLLYRIAGSFGLFYWTLVSFRGNLVPTKGMSQRDYKLVPSRIHDCRSPIYLVSSQVQQLSDNLRSGNLKCCQHKAPSYPYLTQAPLYPYFVKKKYFVNIFKSCFKMIIIQYFTTYQSLQLFFESQEKCTIILVHTYRIV